MIDGASERHRSRQTDDRWSLRKTQEQTETDRQMIDGFGWGWGWGWGWGGDGAGAGVGLGVGLGLGLGLGLQGLGSWGDMLCMSICV